MLQFRKLKLEEGRKTDRYAVIDGKAKRKRLGKVVWRGRYVFCPHPKARVSKIEQKQLNKFVEDLMEQRRALKKGRK